MSQTATYERLGGLRHRHGRLVHEHPHLGFHTHDPEPSHDEHGHSHGLVDDSIKRSRAGLRAVLVSLAVLGATAVAQTIVFAATGSIALLADLIHNFGDALTAVPLGAAFLLRSFRAEKRAGYFVVAAIFISACVAGVEAINDGLTPGLTWSDIARSDPAGEIGRLEGVTERQGGGGIAGGIAEEYLG